MHLTPKEIDKLMLLSLGMVAERRMKKGLKLNYPEAVAYPILRPRHWRERVKARPWKRL